MSYEAWTRVQEEQDARERRMFERIAHLERVITCAVSDLRHSVEGRTATGLVESVIQRLERLVTPGAKL